MIELSSSAIDKSCRMVRLYFPSTLILDILKDITSNQNLISFPNIREFDEKISRTKRTRTRITLKAIADVSTYFCGEQDQFLRFLKSLTSQSIQRSAVSRIMLDDFISKVNAILFKDSKIRVHYETIQKWVPNKAEKDVFLNVNVPEYIEDYFMEALDCLAHDLHRSSIVFSTFALEGSLRHKYGELVGKSKAYSRSVKFNYLIDWAIENNLIEKDDFNKINIDFIRNYRNDLAHFNMKNPSARKKISRSHAQKMSKIIAYLVELFINNIFISQNL